MDAMVRAVYTRGPLAEIEVILDSQTPGDFTARLASVDTVSRMQAGVQRSLRQTEADLTEGKLSSESPIGSALLGGKVNQIVSVPAQKGRPRKYKITKIDAA